MIAEDVALEEGVQVFHPHLVNFYGCVIGNKTKIGAFVEIQKGASVGSNCKISSHSFICEGVDIEDGVFVGRGVMFINDTYPSAVTPDGRLKTTGRLPGHASRLGRRLAATPPSSLASRYAKAHW